MNQNEESCTKIKSLILDALNKPEILLRISARSVEHDNGFMKVVLQERSINDFGFRLHFWDPSTFDSNIHSHRWNMTSIVLQGGYEASEYESFDNGMPYNCYNFKPQINDYSLEPTNIVRLKEVSQSTYAKWQSYELPQGAIHKIRKVSENGAITAVISWGDELPTATVFTEQKILKLESNQKTLTSEFVKNLLKRAQVVLDEYLFSMISIHENENYSN